MPGGEQVRGSGGEENEDKTEGFLNTVHQRILVLAWWSCFRRLSAAMTLCHIDNYIAGII